MTIVHFAAAWALALAAALPAQAQLVMQDDNGRDLHRRVLLKAGGWDISLHSRDAQHRQPVFCRMERQLSPGNWMAYAWSVKETHLDFARPGTGAVGKASKARIYMDSPEPVTEHTAVMAGPAGGEWLRITESRQEMGIEDGLTSGHKLFILVGKERWTYPLAGSGAAFTAVVKCDVQYLSR